MELTVKTFIGEARDVRSLIGGFEGLSCTEKKRWWCFGSTFTVSGPDEAVHLFQQALSTWQDMRLSEDAW